MRKTGSPVTGTPHTHAYRVATGIVNPEVAFYCVVFSYVCRNFVPALPPQQPPRREGHSWYSNVLYLCELYIGLWWVLSQWLSHRARAVKAPIRFPPCAWPSCRREEKTSRWPAAVNAPLPRPSRPASRARYRRGRWCVFSFSFWRGAGAYPKKSGEAHLPRPAVPVS